MNVQCSLIREFMLYNFELGHNTGEAIKNICCERGKGAVDHRTVTKWLKKFHLDCKNLNDQARLKRSKNMDSEAVIQRVAH